MQNYKIPPQYKKNKINKCTEHQHTDQDHMVD